MARVRVDEHGPWVRTNGCVYRPQEAKYSYLNLMEVKTSRYGDGDEVKVRHISQSPHARVGEEVWASHGAYVLDGRFLSSERCWNPRRG